jgi:predicted ATPase
VLAALAWWPLGFPGRAAARSAEAFEIARKIKTSPSSLALTLSWSSLINLRQRDWDAAFSQIDEARKVAHEHGMIDASGFWRGWALVHLGQPEEGLAYMLGGGDWMRALHAWRATFYWGLADVYLAIGRARDGLEAVNHALDVTRAEFEAELRRLKGELLLLGDQRAFDEAAQCFRDAMALAHRQQAKSWELRATMSLARLLAQQGRRDEARAMLADIYGWFTEGFDTADLKDAKALLEELAT